eukprot:GCRY01006122.1.p1 GENE.GCRY01006122.1~~GCRY01006122.1.p1  ORF type:complete len:230 (-),score=28.62 GCRY01006122.1:56-745(-)
MLTTTHKKPASKDWQSDLPEEVKTDFTELQQDLASPTWKQKTKTKSGSVIYLGAKGQYDSKTNLVSVKSTGTITCSGQTLVDFFTANREKALRICDNTLTFDELIEELGPSKGVFHMAYKAPFPVWSREFVVKSYLEQVGEKQWMVMSKSFPADGVPVRRHHVRGEVHMSAFLWKELEELDENGNPQSSMEFVLHMNPKGWLPISLVQLTAADQGMNISRMQEHFARQQ